jgi:hypothetical protein
MGCVQSQSDPSGNNSAGAGNKRNADGGGDNGTAGGGGGASAAPLDPRLPLNARQKYSMLASWKGISRALEPTGIYMFIKYVSNSSTVYATPPTPSNIYVNKQQTTRR